MNYYEHHIGDYERRTAHLTACEDGIYCRLIRLYYMEETPLPNDLKAIQRRVRARSRDEKAAVGAMLEEFFTLDADANVWRQDRCDAEIERYREGDAERAERAANEKERMRRHREERSRLFEQLRERGITPKWDTTVTQLRDMVKRSCNAPETRTGDEHERSCNAPETANQTPDTIYTNQPTNAGARDPDPEPGPDPGPDPGEGTAMHAGWQPSAQFHAVAKLAGLPPQEGQPFAMALAEFVAFWLTRPDERRTQSQWEHAMVKSLQQRRAIGGGSPAPRRQESGSNTGKLPAWRIEELRRLHQAAPSLVDPELLHHIGIDKTTGQPFARPVTGAVIDTAAREVGREPKRITAR